MASPKILVVRLSALGDVLFTLPAVEALRRAHPDAAVDWVVEDKAATLLDLYGGIRRRLVYPRRALSAAWPAVWKGPRALASLVGQVRELREQRYDWVLDFQGNLKSSLQRFAARATASAGFDSKHSKEGSHLGLDRRAAPSADVVHRIDKALALVRSVFPEVGGEAPAPPLVLPDSSRRFAAGVLPALGLDPDEPFVVVHPGTSAFGAFKRWAPDRFARLADWLCESTRAPVLVTWGPGEQALAQSVAGHSKSGQVHVSPATASLGDLAALLQRARLMVGSDSAPLHLAAFLGTPVVALFGPKDPEVYGPRFARCEVVHTYLPCSPCSRRRCPDVLCMEEITVRQVFQACQRLLSPAPISVLH